ncbi:MAG: hypothetical protein OEV93_00040 [Candidatus Moranbacteria bacterium]|nr:hypothetical protein [Candidatus Moranbacteria bacterium]
MQKIVIVFIVVFFCFAPTQKSMAWYGETTANFAAQRIFDEVKEALVSALRTAAIEMINDTVNNLISGATQTSALFITDWEEYLFSSPKARSSMYMNDFFTVTNRGRSSSSGYASGCGKDNFTKWRSAGARQSTDIVVDWSNLQSDFEEYACSVQNAIEEGGWAAFDALFEPNNFPPAYALIAEDIKSQRQEELEKEAEIQAIAYHGYKATVGSDGKTVLTPGSLTKDIQADSLAMSGESLANADSVGGVVGATVGKILTSVIKQGVGNAQKNAQQAINEKICSSFQNISDELGNLSPDGSLFGDLGIGSLGRTSSSGGCTLR